MNARSLAVEGVSTLAVLEAGRVSILIERSFLPGRYRAGQYGYGGWGAGDSTTGPGLRRDQVPLGARPGVLREAVARPLVLGERYGARDGARGQGDDVTLALVREGPGRLDGNQA